MSTVFKLLLKCRELYSPVLYSFFLIFRVLGGNSDIAFVSNTTRFSCPPFCASQLNHQLHYLGSFVIISPTCQSSLGVLIDSYHNCITSTIEALRFPSAMAEKSDFTFGQIIQLLCKHLSLCSANEWKLMVPAPCIKRLQLCDTK